jgi:hypothetical protein
VCAAVGRGWYAVCATTHFTAMFWVVGMSSPVEPTQQYNECMVYLNQGRSLDVVEFAAWFGANNHGNWMKEKGRERTDSSGKTTLQQAVLRIAPAEVIRLLIQAWPEGTRVTTPTGKTPYAACFPGHLLVARGCYPRVCAESHTSAGLTCNSMQSLAAASFCSVSALSGNTWTASHHALLSSQTCISALHRQAAPCNLKGSTR